MLRDILPWPLFVGITLLAGYPIVLVFKTFEILSVVGAGLFTCYAVVVIVFTVFRINR